MSSLFAVEEVGLPVFTAVGLEEAEEGGGVEIDGAGGGGRKRVREEERYEWVRRCVFPSSQQLALRKRRRVVALRSMVLEEEGGRTGGRKGGRDGGREKGRSK